MDTDVHRRRGLALLVAAALPLGGATSAHAAPGDLDPTFGAGGIVQQHVGLHGSAIRDVERTADGSFVALGIARWSDPGDGTELQAALARFTSKGALDGGFGDDGVMAIPADAGRSPNPVDVALGGDGTIMTSGWLTGQCARVTRHGADGGFDLGFDGDGILTEPDGTTTHGAALQADGRAIVTHATAGYGTPSQYELIRLETDGTRDPDFGDGGTAPLTDLNPAGRPLLAPGGRILVPTVEHIPGPAKGYHTQTWRVHAFDADGDVDATYGTGGTASVTTPVGGSFGAAAVAPDGSLLLVGQGGPPPRTTPLATRLTPSGALDTTFGDGGWAHPDPLPDAATELTSVAVTPAGKVVAAGFARGTADGVQRIAVLQLLAGGALDPGFGAGGATRLPASASGTASSLLVEPGGRIVAGGTSMHDDVATYTLVALEGDPPAKNETGTGNEPGDDSGGGDKTTGKTDDTAGGGTGDDGGSQTPATKQKTATARLLSLATRRALRVRIGWPPTWNGARVVVRVRTRGGRLVAERRLRLGTSGSYARVRVPLTRTGRRLLRQGRLKGATLRTTLIRVR